MIGDIVLTCVLAAGAVMLTRGIREKSIGKHFAMVRLSAGAAIDIVRMRARHKHVKAKSEYYWVHRSGLPRMVRWVVDTILGVDSTNATVDRPTKPSESVRVLSVMLRSHELLVELEPFLTQRLQELDTPGAADKLKFAASDILPSDFIYSSEPCTIDVRYRGHSNPCKKIPAKNYLVRYDLGGGEIAQFPPYGVLERQRKGFGVKKIKKAMTQASLSVDITKLAQVCAGPRHNFYADCEDPSVAKNFIDVAQETVVTYAGSGNDGENILLHPYIRG